MTEPVARPAAQDGTQQTHPVADGESDATVPAAPQGRPGWAGHDLRRAALLIGGLTIVARLVGFGRQLVFTNTVGASCLGTAYATANQVPNIIYDVVLGGALTALMVPVLAGPAERALTDPAHREAVSKISSAMLTWTVLILAPVSAVVALAAGPIASALVSSVPGCTQASVTSVAAGMLVVFAPQILLYGLAVVLYGILQSHRRFGPPALAPLLSSAVVIAAYLAFVPLGSHQLNDLGKLSAAAELTLSLGTTAGVLALVLTAAIPARRLGLRLRPALRFPPGVALRVGGLAAVGVVALVAQDASATVVIWLANGHAGHGALVLYGSAWQAFMVPYAVLAIPIAISSFPDLSVRRGAAFDSMASVSARTIVLASSLGSALLAGAAVPLARMFLAWHSAGTASAPRQLAGAMIAFAPGLIGFGLMAGESRVLLADGKNRAAGTWLVAGWMAVIAADLVAVPLVPADWVVPVLGMATAFGTTLAAAGLAVAVRLARGPGALAGFGRAALAGVGGAAAGAVAGLAVSLLAPAASTGPVRAFLLDAGLGLLACVAAVAAFGLVVAVADRGDLRLAAARLRRRVRAS